MAAGASWVGIAPIGQTAEVEITRLVRRKIQVCGSFGGQAADRSGVTARLVADGALNPGTLISRRFPLEEAQVAYRLLAEGKIVGRALIELQTEKLTDAPGIGFRVPALAHTSNCR